MQTPSTIIVAGRDETFGALCEPIFGIRCNHIAMYNVLPNSSLSGGPFFQSRMNMHNRYSIVSSSVHKTFYRKHFYSPY